MPCAFCQDWHGRCSFLFGANYRDLWTTPVSIPVPDLRAFAGGLTPTRAKARGLALRGADGRSYTFRPLLKDPSGLLPVELRESKAKGFVEDQMSSGHPAGHTLVGPLLDATGVLHNEPRIVLMPDDPALGEFRHQFGPTRWKGSRTWARSGSVGPCPRIRSGKCKSRPSRRPFT